MYMKTNWQTKKLTDVIDKVVYTKKIPRKRFLESGKFPIISQEEDFINGYWDKKEDLFKVKSPVVIFGDHTQILKYVTFDFILGADGVKILQPKSFLDPKYFYYFLQSVDLKKLGYARHYRLLKEVDICYPDSIEKQREIVENLDKILDDVSKIRENTLQKLTRLDELKKALLKKAFEGKL